MCHAAAPRSGPRKNASKPRQTTPTPPDNFLRKPGSKRVGSIFEQHALVYLQRHHLTLVARNVVYRSGEIDLILRDPSGMLVFVEVRARTRRQFGGAAASIERHKQRRLVRAALYYLASISGQAPACRFDVIVFEAGQLNWLRDAFRADDTGDT
ncbi:YraN family protein [Paraburkholderia bonniea]|uniref:YraN family protein n=1 Tax=Paraburkholderia bonniea TaxID=2152891 RepID=UPI003CCE01A1